MSTAAEATRTRTVARSTSRARRLKKSRWGRMLIKGPFWLLVIAIFVVIYMTLTRVRAAST